jgi:predicted NBD/HSP70 family sugar kinase
MLTNTPKKRALKNKLIKHLFFEGELTSSELSCSIGKSIPFTTQYINQLIKDNIITENGFASSTGGRRPLVYSLQSGSLFIIAVAMDQFITRIALINEKNEIVGEFEKYELRLPNNPKSAIQLREILKAFLKKVKQTDKIAGIGIGMPGFIDSKKGINHTFIKVEGESLQHFLQASLNIPVFIDNDSSLIALAELKWGIAKDRQNVMVVNIGWGVGLGIIADGKLFKGHDGFAGEFSHIPLYDNHKLCSCGKYGCLETETSLVVITRKVIQLLKTNTSPTILTNLSTENIEEGALQIIEAAKKGDKFSIEALSEAGYQIGRGVAILIHLLNPELVVISGRGSLAGKVWLAPVQQAINEHCIPKIAEHTDLEISQIGNEAELHGAAALVMDNFELVKQHSTKSEKNLK